MAAAEQQEELLRCLRDLRDQGKLPASATFLGRQLGWDLAVVADTLSALQEAKKVEASRSGAMTVFSLSEEEAEFAGVRNRWEVLRQNQAVKNFVEFHDIKSVGGLVTHLGKYGSVVEAFAKASLEIAQPTAEQLTAILPGLSKFCVRLDLAPAPPPKSKPVVAPIAPVRIPPPPPPDPSPQPVPPPEAEEEKSMPRGTQEPERKGGEYPTWERLQKSAGFGSLGYEKPSDFARDFRAANGDLASLFRARRQMRKGLGKTYQLIREYAVGVGLITAEQTRQKAAKKSSPAPAAKKVAKKAAPRKPGPERAARTKASPPSPPASGSVVLSRARGEELASTAGEAGHVLALLEMSMAALKQDGLAPVSPAVEEMLQLDVLSIPLTIMVSVFRINMMAHITPVQTAYGHLQSLKLAKKFVDALAVTDHQLAGLLTLAAGLVMQGKKEEAMALLKDIMTVVGK